MTDPNTYILAVAYMATTGAAGYVQESRLEYAEYLHLSQIPKFLPHFDGHVGL